MFYADVAYFSLYWFLSVVVEVRYLTRRNVSRREWLWRLLNSAFVVATVTFALLVEYDTLSAFAFSGLATASLFFYPVAERDPSGQPGANERFLKTILAMMHPPMLLLLGATWRFIDGAGFFMRWVLPFSTENLRPMCWGFLGGMATLTFFQLVAWPVVRRRRLKAIGQPPEPVYAEESGLIPVSENETPSLADPLTLPEEERQAS